jgi:membrane protein
MTPVTRRLGRTLWAAIAGYQKHNVNRLASSIAFYGILSLAPLGVIGVGVAGSVFGKNAAEGLIVTQLESTLGRNTATALQSVLANAYHSRATVPATIIAVLVLLWSGTRLLGDIRGSLNTIWEVQGHGGTGFRGFLIGKLIDLAMIFVLALLFLLTVAANIALSTITRYFAQLVPFPALLLSISGVLFSFLVAAVFLAVIFRWVPNLKLDLRDVALGACLSAALFELGNYVLGLYLTRSSPGSAFGAAGSLIVIMVWIYYSAIIVLFGVEVARAVRERRLTLGLAVGGPPRQEPHPEGLRVRATPGPPATPGRPAKPGSRTRLRVAVWAVLAVLAALGVAVGRLVRRAWAKARRAPEEGRD